MTPRATSAHRPPDEQPAVLAALLAKSRPLVMGILNVTPDSFSDGGRFIDPETAVRRAGQMIADGADVIDIGAESTRPYGSARPVSLDDELARLRLVLPQIAQLGVPISIDTMKQEVAAWALDHGAVIANDVWGLHRAPQIAAIAASRGAPVVVMHNRDTVDPAIDIMRDIADFFARSLDIAAAHGLPHSHLVLDPGIGFGKTPEQSMTALARLGELKTFGRPVLVGASRKRFIGTISPSETGQRIGGSLAAHLLAVQNGARIIRAHDVYETAQALRVMTAIEDKR